MIHQFCGEDFEERNILLAVQLPNSAELLAAAHQFSFYKNLLMEGSLFAQFGTLKAFC